LQRLKRSLWLLLIRFLMGPTVDGCYRFYIHQKAKSFYISNV
jgi:hypothetical protein